MNNLKKYALCTIVATCFSIDAAIPEAMNKIMSQEKYAHASWGIYVKDSKTGAELIELNSDKMFLPASTTKLFSVEALLSTYGDDYRFKTPVYAFGTIQDGILNGNLVLVGQGDLTFGGRQQNPDLISFTKLDHIVANSVPGVILTPEDPLNAINNLAKQIKEKGIHEINGEIIIDDRLFETIIKRELVLSPIMLNENLIDITLNPSQVGQVAEISVRPKVKDYTFQNNVKTVAVNEKLNIKISADDEGKNIVVEGVIPEGQKNIVRTFPIQNPASFARLAFIEALQAQGIKVNISMDKSIKMPLLSDYDGKEPIAAWTSPPLSEYAKLILKVSHNLGADLVPLLLSAKNHKTTFDDGMKLFGDYVSEVVKVSKDSYVFIDGAGGDENRLTPKAEVKLLEYVRNKPKEQFQKYYDSLPVLGRDGSLEDFGKSTNAVGKVRAKTGTGVAFNLATQEFFLTTQTLTGYLEGKNGNLIEFMIAVNNAKMPAIDDIFPIFEDLSQMTGVIYDMSGEVK